MLSPVIRQCLIRPRSDSRSYLHPALCNIHKYCSAVQIKLSSNSASVSTTSEDVDKTSKSFISDKPAGIQLPGIVALRLACKKLLELKTNNVDDVLFKLHGLLGPRVALRRRILDLSNPQLKQNINYLHQCGISLSSILEHPSVLQFSLPELQIRINHVREVCMKNQVTAQDITSGLDGKTLRSDPDTIKGPWLVTLANKLGCSVQDLVRKAPKKSNALHPRSPKCVLDKIDLLLQAGAGQEQIVNGLGVLNRGLESLVKRCDDIKKTSLTSNEFPLKLLSQGRPQYEKMLEHRRQMKSLLGEHSDRWHVVADKLQCSPSVVRSRFDSFDIRWLLPKVDILLDMGISRDDILLRPKLTSFSIERLKQSKDIIEEYNVEVRANVLRYFLTHTAFPNKTTKSVIRAAICVALNCDIEDISHFLPYMKEAQESSIRQIDCSVDILYRHDFLLSDIRACPLILNYSGDVIETTLTHHQDLLPLSQWKDKVSLLNAAVYVLEQDGVEGKDNTLVSHDGNQHQNVEGNLETDNRLVSLYSDHDVTNLDISSKRDLSTSASWNVDVDDDDGDEEELNYFNEQSSSTHYRDSYRRLSIKSYSISI